jgi:3D (Asp-Asp-Asp) domain-containing protein
VSASVRLMVAALLAATLGLSSSSAQTARNKRIRPMTMTATAYCLRGATADGGEARHGTVAADPRVLPLGSRIRIRGPQIIGEYLVTDRGANVKGRRIDVFMPSCEEARRFGRQRVTVTIVHLAPPAGTTR